MRWIVVLATLGLASAGYVEVNTNYFENIGYPLAEKIRAAEEAQNAPLDPEDVRPKIIGGTTAALGSHPYFGGLVISLTSWPWQGVCGSSLLTANRLVTAAHCWFDGVRQAWQVEVVLGSQTLFSGGQRIVSQQVVMHPQWTPSWLWNDVAIIYLPTNAQLSSTVFPVSLPAGMDLFNTFDGEMASAVGFGVTSDAQSGVSSTVVASEVNLPVISVEDCQRTYGSVFVISSTLCTSGAGRVGVCGGDSGGPLVVQRTGGPILIGVTSFAADQQCEAGHPSGFARVTSFYNFIAQNLG